MPSSVLDIECTVVSKANFLLLRNLLVQGNKKKKLLAGTNFLAISKTMGKQNKGDFINIYFPFHKHKEKEACHEYKLNA